MRFFGKRIVLAIILAQIIILPLILIAVKRQQETRGRAEQTSEVWFAPDFAGDTINLFNEPDKWVASRSKVKVFGWYGVQLTNSCPMCGPNTLDNLTSARAFSKLNNWGIKQSIEVDTVKWHSCTTDKTATRALSYINSILEAGGSVAYIAMDEPYIGGQRSIVGKTPCGYTMEQSAVQTADFISRIKTSYPQVKVGDVEPYPYFSFGQLKEWILKLESLGQKPDFFHLDVNRGHSNYSPNSFTKDAQDFELFLKSRGIPFGIILWSGYQTSDKAFYDDVINWSGVVKAAIGFPQHLIFQSWTARSTSQTFDIPINLPENSPNIYSHTRLINEIVPQSIPDQTPTSTPTPTSTREQTNLLLNIGLDGIGAFGNKMPKQNSVQTKIDIFAPDGQKVASLVQNLAYNQTTGRFEGTIPIYIPNDNFYNIYITPTTFLTKRIDASLAIGKTITIPAITFYGGDINSDNSRSLLDWNILRACSIFEKERNKTLCPDNGTYIANSDIDSNGIVDQDDITLWTQEFKVSAL